MTKNNSLLLLIFQSKSRIICLQYQKLFTEHMPSKKSKQPSRWSVYPALHHDVSRLLDEHNLQYQFQGKADWKRCIKEYDTNIMGRFTCHNKVCSVDGWSSKKIAITIRMYPNNRYDATVYHQCCHGCNNPAKPFLDASYAERVAYRLKKWSGIEMDHPYFSGESKGPHRSDLCEGCKDGHCSLL